MALTPRDQYAQNIKSGASTLGVTLAMTSLTAKFPILANPFLHVIAEHFVEEALSFLIIKTEFSIFFTYIDLRVTKQGRTFYDSIMNLNNARKTGDAKAIKAAKIKSLTDFANLASLTS